MKVVSVNLGEPTPIKWKGKTEYTGIFKAPVKEAIFLQTDSVLGDSIADRRVHGGIHKACYLYSADHYPFWKSRYPGLVWNPGMFGENLTIEGLDENNLQIGNRYRLGTALVEVSMPREPCYKLGIRFGTQKILKEFIAAGRPGTYVRVLQPGKVAAGDGMVLEKASENRLTVADCFRLYYEQPKNRQLLQLAIDNLALPAYKREQLRKYLQ